MRCLVGTLLLSPFLVGFAPAPPVRPIEDPDQAICQFDRQVCAADRDPPDGLTCRRQQLVGRLEDLKQRLALLGRDDEAAAHFARAAAVADRWNAPHWSADARARAARGAVSGSRRRPGPR